MLGHRLLLLACAVLVCLPQALAADSQDPPIDPALLESMQWREVGPYRGGRSAAVAGIPSQPEVYYFGATGGGVWKTQDSGASWQPVSDGFFGGSIGAVAVSEWDPNVVYVGGGEKTVRGNVSHGDGVWKSNDAGKTWSHMGLDDSRHIPRIRIHPRNPDLVYAAVLGHLYGPNEQRGIYRSEDGGATWSRVYSVGPEAGAVDLAMDPTNPRILYASFWRVLRTPYSLESGGEGSGLFKSTDGGDTWTELSGNQGFPAAPLGIIGITVSPTNPENLYAIVEAEKGGVYRSRDGGETWTRTNEQRDLRQRAWYYTRIYADPASEESVYVVNVRFHHSKDGGKTFSTIDTPHGDNHDLWIDPADPLRMIQANDGGANVSNDGGKTWSPQSNQPTAQMYRVSTDNDFPYRLLGGQQDNSAIRIRSRSTQGGSITRRDWDPTAGGESGHIVAHPENPDQVYGGSYGGFLSFVDHRTGERRAVNVWPDNPMGWGAADLTYRFQWNFPIFFSPHDSGILYAAANVLFRSRDGGHSWEAISPDLTRNDASTMGPSGGPITKDNTSVEYYGTIFSALESPHEPGVLWTGSDDGLVFLSRDNGANWTNVTPDSFPEWLQINGIEAHPTEPGGLYLAGTRYKSDDFSPYLYRTLDYGTTWTRIDRGIDRQHFTRALRADPDRPGLLYAGTERGVYVSFDDGDRWQSLQRNLPIVPITDLAIKEKDLVAATQGRGYWILDDLTPLHQLDPKTAESRAALLRPRKTWRLATRRDDEPENAGTNPPVGAVIHFWLDEKALEEGDVRLEILDGTGDLIRTFTPEPDPDAEEAESDDDPDWKDDPRQLELQAGMNRFAWDLRYPRAEGFPGLVLWNRRLDGPMAVPGLYEVRLIVGESTFEEDLELVQDPRSSATREDLEAQLRFGLEARDLLTETHASLRDLRKLREQLQSLQTRHEESIAESELAEALQSTLDQLTEIEETLYQTKNQSPQDPLNFPIRLNDKLAGLLGVSQVGAYPPTVQMIAVKDALTAAIRAELDRWQTIKEQDLLRINDLAQQARLPAVALP